jgi:Domain of unknown function (DUF5054)
MASGGAWWGSMAGRQSLSAPAAAGPDGAGIKRVLAVFKCHFDAGFINTQANVVRRYFDEFFPKAIETATLLSRSGTQRYVWTTGSWLLYEYLEQASAEQRKKMEQAIQSGFIAWHAIPFSWQTELMEPDLISGALALSQSLDRRFGHKTTGAKMTDVPGHTRGLVSPLATNGVTFLDIGVNDASTPALLPPLFRWKDVDGGSLVVMYHRSYGAVLAVSSADFAIAIVVKDDNQGPHTPEEISATYANLKKPFPNAEIIPTDLTKVADEVQPYTQSLPIVTGEIGDTWIHGIASDPLKVARYRELCRLRQTWIREGRLRAGDATDVSLLRHLLLDVEHTWGTDTKTWLDFDNYTPPDLGRMLDTKNYKVVEHSWQEKRQDLLSGVAVLPADLKRQATLAVSSLGPRRPEPLKHACSSNPEIETSVLLLKLDEQTGAILKLQDKSTGREWASPDHLLALFSYQTLSQTDYATFFQNYVISEADWAKKDFGKPNIERFGAESRLWKPSLAQCHSEEDDLAHRLLARLEIRDAESVTSGRAAFPREIFVEFVLPKANPAIEINLSWFGKRPTRLPEALWLSFNPVVADAQGWTMQKSGQAVSPYDVVDSGNRHMHAISDRISCQDGEHKLAFVTLDAPLVSLGRQSPLNFSRLQPNLEGGIHFNLFNNAWGTNYIMWFGEDMRFRFAIEA